MGFLDSSTNNIILDCVLTDTGRAFLAANDGSFSIFKFAFGDDEVNYNIISKYGRTVGKEKIEKNTPIFEALTNQAHALKYKMVTVSNPNLLRLPSFSLQGTSSAVDATSNTITLGVNTQKQATVTVSQELIGESTIDVELRDQIFFVEMPNQFLQVVGDVPENVDGQQRAQYTITRSPDQNTFGGSTVQFALSVKSISDSLFQVYGTSTNKTKIKTFIRITGAQSGAVLDINVIINKTI